MCVHVCRYCGWGGGGGGVRAVRCSNIGQLLCSEYYGIWTKKNIMLCEERYTARGFVCVEEKGIKPYMLATEEKTQHMAGHE